MGIWDSFRRSSAIRGGERREGSAKRLPKTRRNRPRHATPRSLHLERFEDRVLLAIDPLGPQLVAVIPNVGDTIRHGDVLRIAPRDLVFRFAEGQQFTADEAALRAGIRIVGSGGDGRFDNGNEVTVTYGWIGPGDKANEIVARFASTLPDDLYQIVIDGTGADALLNMAISPPVARGEDQTLKFNLDLGPQVVAVVPQPVTRTAGGQLQQARNQIDVYFNNDDLERSAAENESFYQLIATQNTADTSDDVVFLPIDAAYDAGQDKVVLTFAQDLFTLVGSAQAVRLRIGNEYRPIQTLTQAMTVDPGNSFYTAAGGWTLGQALPGGQWDSQSLLVTGEQISPQPWDSIYLADMEWPGAFDEPGHRDLPAHDDVLIEDHFMTGASAPDGTPGPTGPIPYCFPNFAGNLITENQKQRAREIFGLFSEYMGIEFYEADFGLAIITGDLAMMGMRSGPGGVAGLGGMGVALMDFAENWGNSEFGGAWFQVAMHEIAHNLGFGHSYDLPPGTIMGSSEDIENMTGGAEPFFPGDNDVLHGQHMFRPDSADIDLYRFELETSGTFSAETLAERLDHSSPLNTRLTLYQRVEVTDDNGLKTYRYEILSQNDDYYSNDSYLEMYLKKGTYYIGVAASGNLDSDPNIDNTGFGGTTAGRYDLRLTFIPGGVNPDVPDTFTGDGSTFLVDTARTGFDRDAKILFDGDADGVPGGIYNFWFNVQDVAHTIFVDKLATGTSDGSLARPYKTISAAFARAQALPGEDIVRIVGNNFENDTEWRKINAVAAMNGATEVIKDGQIFTIGDDVQQVVFEFDKDTQPGIVAGRVAVPFTATDTAETIAAAVANAINQAQATRGLKVSATAAGRVVTVTEHFANIGGRPLTIDLGSSPLYTSLNDNVPYEIGYGSLSYNPPTRVLSDGAKMEVPQGTTVMIDAGAVFKLGAANLDVGSSALLIDRSSGAIQVLGIPGRPVYFTSHFDQNLGVDTEPQLTTVAKAGDWGGLVFRNDLDYDFINAYDPASLLPVRKILETQGIFLNYVNHADIRYGGGEVTVNGVKSAYAPIHMIEARPTISFNTITRSSDAALSADPNSFADTQFASWDYVAPFTADYDRVGPDVYGNRLVDNSVNGMFVRIRTSAGRPIDELEVPGRFDDWDVVHVMPETLFINGTPGGALWQPATAPLIVMDGNRIQAAAGGDITDAQYFSIWDGAIRATFEFDLGEGHFVPGRISIPFTGASTAEEIAQAIANAINNPIPVGSTQPLPLQVRATAVGAQVILTGLGPTLSFEGLGSTDGEGKYGARIDARLVVDPGLIVKMSGSRIEAEIDAGFIAEGRAGSQDGAPGYKVVFTSLYDDRYGAGGTFDTSNNGQTRVANRGDWAGLNFGPLSEASIDQAIVGYGGGMTAIEGTYASFDVVEIRQAHVRVTNTRFESNQGGGVGGDRNGRGYVQPATIFVRGAQPILVHNDFIGNQGPVISMDANAMKSDVVRDWGRSRGPVDAFVQYSDNCGPMVRANRMTNNAINGMEVRPSTLTSESVWDDTDIVHVLRGEIVIPNYHHEGGLTLKSSASESLVIKLQGANAGFTAMGRPLEIDDRIGGILDVLGTPGHPVVMTALADDTVGAGFDLEDVPQFDTNNDGLFYETDPSRRVGAAPTTGSWRGIVLERYSHDRNVAVVNEREGAYGTTEDLNGTPGTSQPLGQLAQFEYGGDDILRLGFEIHGNIRYDDPLDMDVYSFSAAPGSEIWVDIDYTTYSLDTVVELVDADGVVIARSDNSADELRDSSLLYRNPAALGNDPNKPNLYTMDRDEWLRHDFYSMNPRDAGFRVVLPGDSNPANPLRTYYLRVRSAVAIGNIPAGSALADGQTFAISADGRTVVFQINKPGGIEPDPGQVVPVNIQDGFSPQQVANAILAALATANNDFELNVVGQILDNSRRIVLHGSRVKFYPLSTPLADLSHTSGTYQLQVRLREMQEVPGCAISYADIRYATTGIDVQGYPVHSPLVGESEEGEGTARGVNETRISAVEIGNLLGVDRNTLGVAGYLANYNDVDWYRFEVDYQGIQSIAGINDAGSVWSTIFDIDYADGMARPDLTLWVFDSAGHLILVNRAASISDDLPKPTEGSDLDDLSRGSVWGGDPYIGNAYLPEKQTYYVAVTSTFVTAAALDEPLARQEPVNSVTRVVEEHIDTGAVSQVAVQQDRLTLTPDEFALGDVVMYVNTLDDLYTIDPFTGAFETDLTDYYNNWLPETHSGPYLTYHDIAMRNDGRLYTVTGRATTATDQYATAGRYLRLSTEDARVVLSTQDDGIRTYEINPQQDNPTLMEVNALSQRAAVQFEAMAHDPANARRQVYMVGDLADLNTRSRTGRTPAGLGSAINYVTKNLIYAMDSTGRAVTHPDSSGGARLGTDVVPLGQLVTATTLFAVAATDTGAQYVDIWSPLVDNNRMTPDGLPDDDILDGMAFSLVDDRGLELTFEFDCGPDIRMAPTGPRMIRDGDTFRLSNGLKTTVFEFDSGRVLLVGRGNQFADSDRFMIHYRDAAGLTQSRIFEYNMPPDAPGTVGSGNVAIEITTASTIDEVLVRTVNAINGALGGAGVQATYFPPAAGDPYGRISLTGEQQVTIIQGAGLAIQGEYGLTNPNHVAISFEETDSEQTVAGINDPLRQSGIIWTVQRELPGITVGYAHRTGPLGDTTYGDRFTFFGAADDFSFSSAAAFAILRNGTANNDLRVEGLTAGPALNDVQIRVVPTIGANPPTVSYDAIGKVLTIQFDANVVTVQQVMDAINAASNPVTCPFRATPETTNPGSWGTAIMQAQTVQTLGGVQGVPSFTHIGDSRTGIHYGLGSDVQIVFSAGYSSVDIAEAIVAAFAKARQDFGYNASAVAAGDQVALGNIGTLDPARGYFPLTNPTIAGLIHTLFDNRPTETVLPAAGHGPVLASGLGPGGTITGLAYIGTQAYAVDDAGGLYRVTNLYNLDLANRGVWGFVPVDPVSGMPEVKGIRYLANQGPKAQYITTLTYNGEAIHFSGLTAGPQNVEDGRYANMLFATDYSGHLYAISADGKLQPVFLDGATRVQIQNPVDGRALGTVHGVTFSPIDYNLWHTTNYRGNDRGHGVEPTYDRSREYDDWYRGRTSWYFGLEDPDAATTIEVQPGAANFKQNSTAYQEVYQTYNLPGGAHGSLTTGTFSLKGYSSADQPVVYFTYYARTENSNDYDSLRVYGSADGANWTLLATNTDRDVFGGTIDIVDTGDSWRQARISLAAFAGQENVRLRFDFSTASDIHIGANAIGGAYLAAVPAAKIRDGETFTIDDASHTFEFDLGYAFLVPNAAGRRIADGEWIELAGTGGPVRLEFRRSGTDPNYIIISDTMSAADVANALAAGIRARVPGVTPYIAPSEQDPYEVRVFLTGATSVTISQGLIDLGDLGDPTDPSDDRPTLQGDAPGSVTPGNIPVPIRGDMSAAEVAQAIYDAVNHHFSGVKLLAPSGRNVGEQTTFTISDGTTSLVFEFDSDGNPLLPGSDVRVTYTRQMTTSQVANAIVTALRSTALNTTIVATVQDATITLRHRNTAKTAVITFNPGSSAVERLANDGTAIKWDAALDDDESLDYFLHLIGHAIAEDPASPGTFLSGPLGYSQELPGDHTDKLYGLPTHDRTNLIRRNQNNRFEGWYIDDIIIGFAERGEMITGPLSNPNPAAQVFNIPSTTPDPPIAIVGPYTLEIRRGREYGFWPNPFPPPTLILTDSFDTNDRFTNGITLQAPVATDIAHGDRFAINDGVTTRWFVFLDGTLGGGGGGAAPIYFNKGMLAAQMATAIQNVVNAQTGLKVKARALANSPRVDLFGATDVVIDLATDMPSPLLFSAFGGTDSPDSSTFGDSNLRREQGQLIIEATTVLHASRYGISIGPAERDEPNWPHPGATRTLSTFNNPRLVPGVTLQNNVVAYSGLAGIRFSGDDNSAGAADGAVPFGRIINNTVYGPQQGPAAGRGIEVVNNASPTILNNIVANLDIGIYVDSTSRSTVLGETIYQNNATADVSGIGYGTFDHTLDPDDPLFVNAAAGNFYLKEYSRAIDASLNKMEEREAFRVVKQDLGMPPSPILAPDVDLYGQLRIDDPSVAPPDGMGEKIFKDRGAIDRVDFLGPSASLIRPRDNGVQEDNITRDRNSNFNDVYIAGMTFLEFTVQLADGGVGIDDTRLLLREQDSEQVLKVYKKVRLPGQPTPQWQQLHVLADYRYRYNPTNDVIHIAPTEGFWAVGEYRVELINAEVRDRADNPLQSNRPDGRTYFDISLVGVDFGDAPDTGVPPTYPSRLEHDGARHLLIENNAYLGDGVTSEPDARYNNDATGDEDDGVQFHSPLVIGGTTYVTVRASGAGYLNAWFDFNGDGVWENTAQEHVISAVQWTAAGSKVLAVPMPAGGTARNVYARFRFTSDRAIQPTGEAPDGEVEDYMVPAVAYLEDFGDAPAASPTGTPWYPTTLAADGARHRLANPIDAGIWLGAAVDYDPDGQPTTDATGDDLDTVNHPVLGRSPADTDDEDGVRFDTLLIPGSDAQVTVTVTSATVPSAYLYGWIDFTGDHDWDDAGEYAIQGVAVSPGSRSFTFSVPFGTLPGQTFARFRLSTQQGLSYSGPAPDGEVEDYQVTIVPPPLDFGDAPDNWYPTSLGRNGARHQLDAQPNAGIILGTAVDNEDDSTGNAAANLDDLTGTDDEDGVVFLTPLVPGNDADVRVTVSSTVGDGYLNAWIDFSGDHDWDDPGEQIFGDGTGGRPIAAGTHTLTFRVPAGAVEGETYARFRVSRREPILSYTGSASDGEVEDYRVTIMTAPIDFGDAPDASVGAGFRYPTTLADNGARHELAIRLGDGILLGDAGDPEANGRPSLGADGDDLSDTDDEEGLLLVPPLVPGENVQLQMKITGSLAGFLTGWIDFNRDGDWDDADEHIQWLLPGGGTATDYPVTAGTYNLELFVPAGAVLGTTYARFRVSTQQGLSYTGLAPNGEVEDYQMQIIAAPLDYGDAPSPYATRAADNGAFHRVIPSEHLGQYVDFEPDGQPDATATGDDLAGTPDDEDGVFIPTLVLGQRPDIFVTVSAAGGFLNAWIDYNGNGVWEAAEKIADGLPLPGGTHRLLDVLPNMPAVPIDAHLGATFARFRFSSNVQYLNPTGGNPNAGGPVPNGEVEDYQVTIVRPPEDYGDAPTQILIDGALTPTQYHTLLDDNGPHHVPSAQIHLGATFDVENDGQPVDLTAGDGDDEDGIQFSDTDTRITGWLTAGQDGWITVTAVGTGYLSGWIDFNFNGVWDASEAILLARPISTGTTALRVVIPDATVIPHTVDTFARFRFSSDSSAVLTPEGTPQGPAPDGEVEDYQVHIRVGESSISGWKFNDLDGDGQWDQKPLDVAQHVEIRPATAGSGTQIISNADMMWSLQSLGFTFEFGGTAYDQFYVNVDGAVTFGWPLFSSVPGDFPQSVGGTPMLAPFWADADTRNGAGSVFLERGTSVRGNPFIQIDWLGVGYASQHVDKGNTFSLYLEDDPGGDIAAFLYGSMEWAVADTGGGSRGFGGFAPAQVGFDAGDGATYYSAMRPVSRADLDDLMAAGRYVFRFDPATGAAVGPEPGMAGVLIYLDSTTEGTFGRFDYQDVNGNGIFEPLVDVALERYRYTSVDDPNTLQDETGYYEFNALFDGQYVVRELPWWEMTVHPDWVQTGPVPGTTLPDGSVANSDFSWSIDLDVREDVTDVNFGNYRMAHVAVTDVAVAEGNSGRTEVRLTLQLTESFGAPVTVYYYTQDGTATVANLDYEQVLDGVFTFSPQAVPANTWKVQSLTKNVGNDFDYVVWGNRVAWEGYDGNDWEIYLYDGQNIQQLTNNNRDDRFVTLYGANVAWSGFDGNDYEIFLFDGTEIRQVTDNAYDDKNPRVSATHLTWWGATLGSNTNGQEIFLYDIAARTTRNISNNSTPDYEPRISGAYVVWSGSDGVDQEIYFYNGLTNTLRQLTNNNRLDQRPEIDGENIVWEGYDGQDYEIYRYRVGQTGSPVPITQDSDGTSDTSPFISGNRVVWTRVRGNPNNAEIYLYDIAADETTPLTSNSVLDEYPRIYGDNVVWHTRVSTSPLNYDVYYANLSSMTIPVNISRSLGFDWYPQVSNDLIVWRNYDGTDYEIVVAKREKPMATAAITLYINGDTTFEPDEFFRVRFTGADLAYLVDAQDQIQSALEARVDVLNDDGTLDYGDAPAQYPVLLSSNGARHRIVSGMYLGARVDTETNGQPSAAATGDDTLGFDDEDGVTFSGPLIRGGKGRITVTASQAGQLDAWIDFDGDGSWEPQEKLVFSGYTGLAAGVNELSFEVPATAKLGTTFARFRYSSAGGLLPTGSAADGEVEDYAIDIVLDPATVVLQNRAVTVTGSAQDDIFSLSGSSTLVVTINGRTYQYAAADVDRVVFDGGAGNDQATVIGTDAAESAALAPLSALFTRTGLQVAISNTETISVDLASGADQVSFTDSAGNDTLTVRLGNASMTGPGFSLAALGFETLAASSTVGGSDTANLYDSNGDDTYTGTTTYGELVGPGFEHRVDRFEAVNVTAGRGIDTANLYGSSGNDTALMYHNTTRFYGSGFMHRPRFFDVVVVDCRNAGTDRVSMYDSPDNDTFTAKPTEAQVAGAGFNNKAIGYDWLALYSTTGGSDTAYLYGASGNDSFTDKDATGVLTGSGFRLAAKDFEALYVDAGAGDADVAYLYDSPGNDTLVGYPTYVKLTAASGRITQAKLFETVIAYGTTGWDIAKLYDSSGNDTFTGKPTESSLVGPGYRNIVRAFDEVYAYGANGGYDRAFLYDSPGDDHLEAAGSKATVNKVDLSYLYSIDKFEYAKATSTTGRNTKRILAIDYVLNASQWV